MQSDAASRSNVGQPREVRSSQEDERSKTVVDECAKKSPALTRAASAQDAGFGEVVRALDLMELAPDEASDLSYHQRSLLPLGSLSAIGGPVQASPTARTGRPGAGPPRYGHPPGYVPRSGVYL